MKATTKEVTHVNLGMKESGANVLRSTFVYSKSIGKLVAGKEGLTGDAATARAEEIKRALRRVRIALEGIGA